MSHEGAGCGASGGDAQENNQIKLFYVLSGSGVTLGHISSSSTSPLQHHL
jgi:hypothetical protein